MHPVSAVHSKQDIVELVAKHDVRIWQTFSFKFFFFHGLSLSFKFCDTSSQCFVEGGAVALR